MFKNGEKYFNWVRIAKLTDPEFQKLIVLSTNAETQEQLMTWFEEFYSETPVEVKVPLSVIKAVALEKMMDDPREPIHDSSYVEALEELEHSSGWWHACETYEIPVYVFTFTEQFGFAIKIWSDEVIEEDIGSHESERVPVKLRDQLVGKSALGPLVVNFENKEYLIVDVCARTEPIGLRDMWSIKLAPVEYFALP